MKRFLFLLVTVFSISGISNAETIQISVSKQSPHMQTIDRPKGGMNKQGVEQKFGPPQEMTEAVGNPPISMWIYKDFSVYFEHDLVLHSVLHQNSAAK